MTTGYILIAAILILGGVIATVGDIASAHELAKPASHFLTFVRKILLYW
ncbi:hypothetical protein [Nostoc sphaeroides]